MNDPSPADRHAGDRVLRVIIAVSALVVVLTLLATWLLPPPAPPGDVTLRVQSLCLSW